MADFTLPPEAKPVNSHVELARLIQHRLSAWLPGVYQATWSPDHDKFLHPRVSALVAVYDAALARLEGKTGTRAEAARKLLTDARAPFAAQLQVVDGLGAGLDRPLALEYRARIDSTRAALAKVLHAIHAAKRADIAALVVEREGSLADCRELERDLAALYESIMRSHTPAQLDELLAAAASAEVSTQALEALPAKPRAVDVAAAITQGLEAPAHVAALFVAYETKPDHPAIKWRTQALAERS